MTPRLTGETASRWEQLPTRVMGNGTIVGGTRNGSYKAAILQNGWAAHEIDPRRAAALNTPRGPRASAEVPAHEGFHMLSRASAEVEVSWAPSAAPDLAAWAAEVERRASGG